MYVGSAVGTRLLLKADHILVKGCIIEQSLPSRERGLKYASRRHADRKVRSLPSRERGLKSNPRAPMMKFQTVAPFTGAWIEMGWMLDQVQAKRSLPSRERGLKSLT